MWQIQSDNRVSGTADELHKLNRSRRLIAGKTLFIECPQFPVMDSKTACFIAEGRLSDAVIGQCEYIVVRGKVWKYEYKTLELNRRIQKVWGNRTGMVQNPAETICTGSFYDTTRQLWAVPSSYRVRETIKFPA